MLRGSIEVATNPPSISPSNETVHTCVSSTDTTCAIHGSEGRVIINHRPNELAINRSSPAVALTEAIAITHQRCPA